MDYLNRVQAPLPKDLWAEIDEAATDAARARLTGRRFLDVEGPYGAGLTTIEVGNDDFCREPGPNEAGAVLGRALSVPMLRKSFKLSIRRIASWRQNGQPLDLSPVEDAAEAVARREEEFVYYGQPNFGLPGLLTSEGATRMSGGDWSQVDVVLRDVLAAVERLDANGFAGPYALVASHTYYNNLFRRYEGTDMLQIEHLNRLCTCGIYKAPIEGAAVVDPRVGKIIIGQDMMAGYEVQDGVHFHLYLSESMVLKLDEPEAVCVIDSAAASQRPDESRGRREKQPGGTAPRG